MRVHCGFVREKIRLMAAIKGSCLLVSQASIKIKHFSHAASLRDYDIDMYDLCNTLGNELKLVCT